MMCDVDTYDFIKDNGYIVCSVIGKGGFSCCYDVYSDQYKEHFACKSVSIAGNKSESGRKSFYKELNALTHVIHPNIIPVFKAFANETNLFLILEYCPNGDLHNYVKRKGAIKDDVNLLYCIYNILNAFSYLEMEGIAHKDVKPANILIDKYGRPKIADFGLSELIRKDELCSDFNGSLAFIAPEILNKKPYDSIKADIWSFGVTIYYIATGRFPFPITDRELLINYIRKGIISDPMNINKTVKYLITNSLVLNPKKRMSFTTMKGIVEVEMKKMINYSLRGPLLDNIAKSEYIRRLTRFNRAKSNLFYNKIGPLCKPKIKKCNSESI